MVVVVGRSTEELDSRFWVTCPDNGRPASVGFPDAAITFGSEPCPRLRACSQRVLPILLFETGWKLTWLGTLALPLWLGGNLTGGILQQANMVLRGDRPRRHPVRHVVRQYVLARAGRDGVEMSVLITTHLTVDGPVEQVCRRSPIWMATPTGTRSSTS
jgi:hypothetical protein